MSYRNNDRSSKAAYELNKKIVPYWTRASKAPCCTGTFWGNNSLSSSHTDHLTIWGSGGITSELPFRYLGGGALAPSCFDFLKNNFCPCSSTGSISLLCQRFIVLKEIQDEMITHRLVMSVIPDQVKINCQYESETEMGMGTNVKPNLKPLWQLPLHFLVIHRRWYY